MWLSLLVGINDAHACHDAAEYPGQTGKKHPESDGRAVDDYLGGECHVLVLHGLRIRLSRKYVNGTKVLILG